jgi:hypothetical protein
MNNYYIYFHKNPKTYEIFYVGLGSHILYQKYKRAEDLKKRGKHYKYYIEKYGNPIIEIIHDNLSQEEACLLEIKYISQYGRKKYETNGILVNKSLGGQGGKQGVIVTKETRLKQSLKLKGVLKPKGFGDKISKNRNHKEAGRLAGISNQKHYTLGSDRNNKISKALKGRLVDWTGDIITQYDLNEKFIKEWPSIRQAGLEIANTNGETIRKCLKGLQKTAYGFKWKYKENLVKQN